MAKRKSPMDQLGGAFDTPKRGRRKKSPMDQLGASLKNSRGRRARKGGMLAVYDNYSKTKRGRKRKPVHEQMGQAFDISRKRKRRGVSAAGDLYELTRQKLTKTEYLQLRDEADRAQEVDDNLRERRRDSALMQDQGFVARLARMVRRRTRFF